MKHIDTCPYCKSHNIQDRITEAQCLDCGSIDSFVETQYYALSPEPDIPDISDIEDRIGNLEAISAEPGRIPRAYHDELKQIKAQLIYLQLKVMQQRVEVKQKEATVGNNREDITDRLYR